MRTCSQAISDYTLDHRGAYPYFADINNRPAFVNGGYGLEFEYQSIHWPMVMEGRIGPVRFSEARYCPDALILDESLEDISDMHPASYVHPSNYHLGEGFFTDPRLWRADADPLDTALYRPVRAAEVTFPSGKGLLAEVVPYHRLDQSTHVGNRADGFSLRDPGANGRFNIAFADGSTRGVRMADLAPGITPGTGEPNVPVLNTQHGAHGIDLSKR